MKKHLKYIDGTADKFWEIKAEGIQIVINYGKNGTTGTTQTKVFDTEESCLKIAQKLIDEKLKKGYSESGVVNVVPTAKASNAKQKLKEITDEFDQIIINKQTDKLLVFLQEKTKGVAVEFKKYLKKTIRYWLTYTNLQDEPGFMKKGGYYWGVRADEVRKKILVLSGIALYDKSEIGTLNEEVLNILSTYERDFTVKAVLNWAKPNWLNEYLLRRVKQNSWEKSYYLLRALEADVLVVFEPELFALNVANYHGYRHYNEKPHHYIEKICTDKVAYERDALLVFEYECEVNCIYNENYRNKSTELKVWNVIFKRLLDEQKINRKFILEKSLLVQTKEWENAIKLYFRQLIEYLEFTTDECIEFQSIYFTFLQHSFNQVVNFGVDFVKANYTNPKFKTNDFLDWVEPILMRNDCKGSIKKLILIFEAIAKKNPKLASRIAQLTSNIFLISDLTLQERASKTILKFGNQKDAVLKDNLSMYAPQMLGNIKTVLKDFIDETTDFEEALSYEFDPKPTQKLVEKVEIPQTWNDILFQIGKFSKSEDVIDYELVLNVFATQRHLFPENYSKQFEPLRKQIAYLEGFAQQYLANFLKQKMENFSNKYKIDENKYYKVKIFNTCHAILKKLEQKINQNSHLPLLSFPTHLPYWIAPKTLLERIIDYQNNNETIDLVDLCIAISRMPLENIDEALPLLDQLNDTLKPVFSFCFGQTKTINLEDSGMLSKILSTLTGETLKTKNDALWAVAARTFYPNETFPVFEKTVLKTIPFVVAPYLTPVVYKTRSNKYRDYQTKQDIITTWSELSIDLPNYHNMPDHLIYGLDTFYFNSDSSWYYGYHSDKNVYYAHSIMPQNLEPLSLNVLRTSCITPQFSKTGLNGYLTILSNTDASIDYYSRYVLASSFFVDKKELRMMTTEVLYSLIEKQKIDINDLGQILAQLINNEYGVFGRFIDSINTMKDSTPLHNSALFLLFDAILSNLNPELKLPTHFKKMIESLYDLSNKVNHKLSVKAITALKNLEKVASLKKLVLGLQG